jgi:hypothetical protein
MTNYNTVPVTYMRDSVQRYLEDRLPPESFLRALFSNDLHGAYGKADAQNQACMFEWVRFMVNEMPGESWGSPETVAAWLANTP